MSIRPFIFETDIQKIFGLWNRTLKPEWPISFNDFSSNIAAYDNKSAINHFVAEEGSTIVGFVSSQSAPSGSITCIMVDEHYQRRGIGSDLLENAIYALKEKGIKKIQLGGGGYSYFWPGVPKNLPHAVSFFEKNRWNFTEESVDMLAKLQDYETPEFVYDHLDRNITISFATAQDETKILEFESKCFPDWVTYYEEKLGKDLFHEVLLAKNNAGDILGTVIVSKRNSIWRDLVEGSTGTLGALGVKEGERRKGIGLALAAKATEVLKSENVDICYLGWTWLIDWYGKLGYKIWREYQMSWKEV